MKATETLGPSRHGNRVVGDGNGGVVALPGAVVALPGGTVAIPGGTVAIPGGVVAIPRAVVALPDAGVAVPDTAVGLLTTDGIPDYPRSMARDYIPRSDSEFNDWFNNFNLVISADPISYGETVGTGAAVDTAFQDWQNAYNAHKNAQIAAQAALTDKDAKREAAEVLIRAMVRRIQSNAAVTDAMKNTIQITVADTTLTGAEAPTSHPVLSIDTSERLRHTISFKDNVSTARGKPAGVFACEIWRKIGGAPPVDSGECTFLALDTASPYLAVYNGAEANQVVHYMARWVSTRNEPGPWGLTESATVTA